MKCTCFLFTNPHVLATWWLPLGCTVCPLVAIMFSTNSRMVNFTFKHSFSVNYLVLRFRFLFFSCCMKDVYCFYKERPNTKASRVITETVNVCQWRIQGGTRDACRLPVCPMSFIIMQFLAQIVLNNRLVFPSLGLVAPPEKSWIRNVCISWCCRDELHFYFCPQRTPQATCLNDYTVQKTRSVAKQNQHTEFGLVYGEL